jgi:hypothetical protein
LRHAQVVGKRQIAVERPFISCATVDTLVVAAIRNRDPEIGDGTSEFVAENQLLAPKGSNFTPVIPSLPQAKAGTSKESAVFNFKVGATEKLTQAG